MCAPPSGAQTIESKYETTIKKIITHKKIKMRDKNLQIPFVWAGSLDLVYLIV